MVLPVIACTAPIAGTAPKVAVAARGSHIPCNIVAVVGGRRTARGFGLALVRGCGFAANGWRYFFGEEEDALFVEGWVAGGTVPGSISGIWTRRKQFAQFWRCAAQIHKFALAGCTAVG